jgi:hypothetical protein
MTPARIDGAVKPVNKINIQAKRIDKNVLTFSFFFYFLQNYFISESSYVTKVTIANFGFE